ncbi:MAG: twin-arginine translocase TatA/TatE family subunit [Candidatus Bathyarchaeota archaeon]|nr:MAG: twin-arginine translocase TatA/TatE family subunit [Candidatus Bathyarchaeota archaeon]
MIGMQEVILILAILLLVFGPSKIPKIARELGKAWHEFNKASSSMINAVNSPQTTQKEVKDNLLQKAAERLNLDVKGKTDRQLTEELLTKVINKEETLTSEKEEA